MRFNFKRIVKFLTVSILCLLSVSCSLLLNGTGNIQFKLPTLEQSCSNYGIAVAAANNQTDFNIVLKTQNGKTVYNEFHEAGSVVYIDNIPSGKYEISLEAITHTDIYAGKENVHVKAGKGASVNVRLGKNPIKQNDGIVDTPTEKPDVPESEYRTVTIKFKSGGDPVDYNIKVRLVGATTTYEATGISDKALEFTRVLDGEYTVEIESLYYKTNTVKKVKVEGFSVQINLNLIPKK